jgi:hypothetical protein
MVKAGFYQAPRITTSKRKSPLDIHSTDPVIHEDAVRSHLVQYPVTSEDIHQSKKHSRVIPTSTTPDRHNTTRPSAIAAPQTTSNDILTTPSAYTNTTRVLFFLFQSLFLITSLGFSRLSHVLPPQSSGTSSQSSFTELSTSFCCSCNYQTCK